MHGRKRSRPDKTFEGLSNLRDIVRANEKLFPEESTDRAARLREKGVPNAVINLASNFDLVGYAEYQRRGGAEGATVAVAV